MSDSFRSPGFGRHWAESESDGVSHRNFYLALLGVLIVAGTGGFFWWVFCQPERPRTHFAAWYSAEYGDGEALPFMPFAETSAGAFADGLERRGATGVLAMSEPRPLAEGGERVVQEAERLLRETRRADGGPISRQDVIVIYLRGYALDMPTGETETESGEAYEAVLLAGGAGPGERVRLRELFGRLAAADVRAVVVLLDTSDLSGHLREGVLVNGFSEALESLLSRPGDDWSRLWVISSGSVPDEGHLSWPEKRTLLASALSPRDWNREDTDGDGRISLSECYERVLRFSEFHTGGRQTPLLFRGGRGLCRPEGRDPDWEVAKSIPIIQTMPLPPPENAEEDDAGPGRESDDRRDPVTAESSASEEHPAGQGGGDSARSGEPAETENPDAAAPAKPTAGESVGQLRQRFVESPREATWRAVELVAGRRGPGGWSPVDYAPGSWRQTLHDLVQLDRKDRAGKAAPEAWEPYFRLLTYLIDPDRESPPAIPESYRALVEMRRAWQDPRRDWRRWAAIWETEGERLDPQARKDWPEIRATLRHYCDAMAELAWWVELSGRVEDLRGVGDLQALLRDARIDLEMPILEPEKASRIVPWGSQIDEKRRAIRLSLAEEIGRRERLDGQDWTRNRQIDAILRSPLLGWDDRERLEAKLMARGVEPATLERNSPLIEVWGRGRAVGGARWGRVAQWGDLQRSLLELVAGAEERELPSVTASNLESARRWGREYRRFWQTGSVESRTAFARWRQGVLAGPLAFRSDPAGEPAAMVLPVRLDPNLRLLAGEGTRLTRSGPGRWSCGDSIMLEEGTAIQGFAARLMFEDRLFEDRPGPQRCRLRVIDLTPESALQDVRDFLGLSQVADGPPMPWDELLDRGVEIRLRRGGELTLFASVREAAGEYWDTPVTLEFGVEAIIEGPARPNRPPPRLDARLEVPFTPPLPDHVDLWVTPAGFSGDPTRPTPEARRLGRRARPSVADGVDPHELLYGNDALLAIPNEEAGVPYRFWLANRSRRDRAVRARLFAIPRVDLTLRPGRLIERRGLTPPDRHAALLELRARIADGSQRPWAESEVVRLAPAVSDRGGRGGGEGPDLPAAAEPLRFGLSNVADEPSALPLPHGFVCVIEEMEPWETESDETGTADVRWRTAPGSRTWYKWVEVAYHPILRSRGADDVGDTLVVVDPEPPWTFSERRGELSFRIRAETASWERYALGQLPVEVWVDDERRQSWELSADDPEITATVRVREQDRQLHLSLGGFPRLESYKIGGPGGPVTRVTDGRRARIWNVAAVTSDGVPHEPESRVGRADGEAKEIVLRAWEEVDGGRREVRYDTLKAAVAVDAPWTSFQDFRGENQSDAVELVLRRPLGEAPIRSEARRSPRRERFSCIIDEDLRTPRIKAVISDHQEWEMRLPQLDEGRFELFSRLMLDGQQAATSDPLILIVDRTPPDVDRPRRLDAEDRDRRDLELWPDQTIDVEVEVRDRGTEVSAVRIGLRRPDGSETPVWSDAQRAEGNLWRTVLDAKDLAAAKLTRGEYELVGEATDLAGNRSHPGDTRGTPLRWQNRPRPEAGDRDDKGMDPEMPTDETFEVLLEVSREGFRLRNEHLSGVDVRWKPSPGVQTIRNNALRFADVPGGQYQLEISQRIRTGTYGLSREIAIPDDLDADGILRVRLEPE